jgi:serine protease Do
MSRLIHSPLIGRLTASSALLVACLAPWAPIQAAETPLERLREAERERVQLIETISESVISLFRVNSKTGRLAPGSGSGVIISPDGYALTNFHVTGKSENLRVGLPGGRICPAQRLGVDPTGDIALIKITSDIALPYAKLGSSDALEVGQWVIAVGNPFLLATDFRPTVSVGIVSGLHRYLPGTGMFRHQLVYADAIQIDAALNPGNSGGPLFDCRGEVVGINGRITLRRVEGMRMRKTNMGVGFAIPIDGIKPFLEDLKAGRNVDRGYLGVTAAKVVDEGLKVEKIEADSPADIYDLKKGDTIIALDGRPVADPGDLINMVNLKPAGTTVTVRLRRDGQIVDLPVQLAGVQNGAWLRMLERSRGTRYRQSVLRKTEDQDKTDEAADGEGDTTSPPTPGEDDTTPTPEKTPEGEKSEKEGGAESP